MVIALKNMEVPQTQERVTQVPRIETVERIVEIQKRQIQRSGKEIVEELCGSRRSSARRRSWSTRRSRWSLF